MIDAGTRGLLNAAMRGMRTWALASGVAGIVLTSVGYGSVFQGWLVPLEGVPLIILGQAGLAVAIVLAVLASIIRRAIRKTEADWQRVEGTPR